MITYSDIATKDDKAFHRVARKALCNDYYAAVEEASEAFKKAYKSSCDNKRENAARREANLVIVRWLKEYGITNWKDENQKPTERRKVEKSNFASEKVKARKYNSQCGLWETNIK